MTINKNDNGKYIIKKDVNGKTVTLEFTNNDMMDIFVYMHQEMFEAHVKSACWDADYEVTLEDIKSIASNAYDIWLDTEDPSEADAVQIALEEWKEEHGIKEKEEK